MRALTKLSLAEVQGKCKSPYDHAEGCPGER